MLSARFLVLWNSDVISWTSFNSLIMVSELPICMKVQIISFTGSEKTLFTQRKPTITTGNKTRQLNCQKAEDTYISCPDRFLGSEFFTSNPSRLLCIEKFFIKLQENTLNEKTERMLRAKHWQLAYSHKLRRTRCTSISFILYHWSA